MAKINNLFSFTYKMKSFLSQSSLFIEESFEHFFSLALQTLPNSIFFELRSEEVILQHQRSYTSLSVQISITTFYKMSHSNTVS